MPTKKTTPAGREGSAASRIDPNALELEVLQQWEREKTFEASLRRREGAPRYSFTDGPPYATGSPHYGQILQTTIKDAVTRYWTMRGYRVDRRVGWDCHGLPVENLVEKELGITNKKDIEKLGVEKFNAACRAVVFRNVEEFQEVLQRVGRWADYAQSYATLDPGYMESVWWVFKQVWDHGLVTHGFRSSPYCPRCATPLSNFETALGYKETEDPAITVKLPVTDRETTFLLIWTTTPWTLPGNVAVAVHPDLRYVQVKVGDEHWILAKDRLADVVDTDTVVEEEFTGSQLVGLTYEPLYTFLEPDKPAYRVVPGTFVTATEGTGIVHLAPAFGEEDLQTAQVEDLPIFKTVDEHGAFIDAVTPWAGRFVKDADAGIMRDLGSRGLLLREERYRHEYPFCWRCDTPLIYYATHSWFITVSKIREQLLRNNERITWVPEHLKHGRFAQGLKDAPDWAISRSRYWGTPIPVWECAACLERTVIGSIAELTERGADLSPLYPRGKGEPPDLHRPAIDAVVFPCPKCGGEARRIPEVFDVWMDSGCVPYAQWHYPFENKERVEQTFPADFIAEGLDQTRGWFYTLHVLAAILTSDDRGLGRDQPAFKNAVVSGLVLAEDGKKLSKRLKNYPDVLDVVKRYGADTLRLYLLSSQTFGEDARLSERLLGEFSRKFTLPLFHVLSFYETYARASGRAAGAQESAGHARSLLDRWILTRVGKVVSVVRSAMDAYHIDRAARELTSFVEDLSNWYVRRSRKRFSDAGTPDQQAAFATLEEVLKTFALVSAPLTPFFSEVIVRRVGGSPSPHLADFPDASAVDDDLLSRMVTLRELVSAGLQARATAGIRVRQPLQTLVVVAGAADGLDGEWRDILAGEVNVKDVEVADAKPSGEYAWAELPGGRAVGVLTTLGADLVNEGIARDLIRHTQELRKSAGLTVRDQVELVIDTADPAVRDTVERFSKLLARETRATVLDQPLAHADGETTVTVHGSAVTIRLRRV